MKRGRRAEKKLKVNDVVQSMWAFNGEEPIASFEQAQGNENEDGGLKGLLGPEDPLPQREGVVLRGLSSI